MSEQRRNFGRKVAFVFSTISFAAGAASVTTLVYSVVVKGTQHIMTSSMFATSVFFIACGIVLYQISKPPQHSLLPWDAEE